MTANDCQNILAKISSMLVACGFSEREAIWGFDGEVYRLYFRVTDGVSENVRAEHGLSLNFHDDDFEIRISASAYNLEDRRQAESRTSYASLVSFFDFLQVEQAYLEDWLYYLTKAKQLASKIVSDLPVLERNRQGLLQELRDRGLLLE